MNEVTPPLPLKIGRQKVNDALELLGIPLTCLRSVTIHLDGITVEQVRKSEDSVGQLNSHWTHGDRVAMIVTDIEVANKLANAPRS